jgi:hypothetical protein
MKQYWQNFYGSKHCFQHGDLKKNTWAGTDHQSSLQNNSMQLSHWLPLWMEGSPLMAVRDANPAPRHFGASDRFQQNAKFAWVQLTGLGSFMGRLCLPGGCAGFHPIYSSVCHLCKPMTLEDEASPVTVLSWHPLACSVGHLCKPLVLEEALGPLFLSLTKLFLRSYR